MKIKKIKALEVFDSRGVPALECILYLDNELSFKAKVPSGISKSRYELPELRDGGQRYSGQGLQRSIELIEDVIAPKFVGRVPDAIQMDLDLINLDSNPKRSSLGANTTLAISMCIYRAQAYLENLELFEFISYIIGKETVTIPIPILNFIDGGLHACNNLSIQEYLVIPAGAQSFAQSMEKSWDYFNLLKVYLEKNTKNLCMSNSGGFSANFNSTIAPLEFLHDAKKNLGLREDFFMFGLDVSASHIYDQNTRLYQFEDDLKTTQQLIDWYKMLVDKYEVYYLQDPLNQDDVASWVKLTSLLSEKCLISGDDIFATDLERVVKGVESFCANSVVIKMNQIGTVTEAIQVVKVSHEAGLATVVSSRFGDSEDDFISDLAVGVSSNFIKSGGLVGSHNLAKYNRLIEIESYLLSIS